ncbi:hypothetical protein [Luteimonas aquatica]|uniref:hypothetical protein n=1 Tax=Luteimonas aquatica TaxID=450364 RepID=UPI001F5AA370|nr:hypothetical protein [Luteimonas aquatica]
MPSAHAPPRLAALPVLLGLPLLLAACSVQKPPFAQLSGMLMDDRLNEVSGLAASRAHEDVLWMLDDGGHAPRLFAVGTRGQLLATFRVDGIANTDWEDLSAFELDGRRYLLVADTGDNGGLRRSLQLHVFEEPAALDAQATGRALRPDWSIAFRWPDGARDCEAVAVDPILGQVLLISKKRTPPELFAVPLRPRDEEVQVAQRLGTLTGVPPPSAEELRANARMARIRHQVTAADIAPDRGRIAVMTYNEVLLYRRGARQNWAQALAGKPAVHELPWLPQAEALGWAQGGRGLFATGEFAPAPLLYLNTD